MSPPIMLRKSRMAVLPWRRRGAGAWVRSVCPVTTIVSKWGASSGKVYSNCDKAQCPPMAARAMDSANCSVVRTWGTVTSGHNLLGWQEICATNGNWLAVHPGGVAHKHHNCHLGLNQARANNAMCWLVAPAALVHSALINTTTALHRSFPQVSALWFKARTTVAWRCANSSLSETSWALHTCCTEVAQHAHWRDRPRMSSGAMMPEWRTTSEEESLKTASSFGMPRRLNAWRAACFAIRPEVRTPKMCGLRCCRLV